MGSISTRSTKKASSEFQRNLFLIFFRHSAATKRRKNFFKRRFTKFFRRFNFPKRQFLFSRTAIADNAFKQLVFRNAFPCSFFTLPKVDTVIIPTFSSWRIKLFLIFLVSKEQIQNNFLPLQSYCTQKKC